MTCIIWALKTVESSTLKFHKINEYLVKIQRFIAVLMLEKDIKDCENDCNVPIISFVDPLLEVLKENNGVKES